MVLLSDLLNFRKSDEQTGHFIEEIIPQTTVIGVGIHNLEYCSSTISIMHHWMTSKHGKPVLPT